MSYFATSEISDLWSVMELGKDLGRMIVIELETRDQKIKRLITFSGGHPYGTCFIMAPYLRLCSLCMYEHACVHACVRVYAHCVSVMLVHHVCTKLCVLQKNWRKLSTVMPGKLCQAAGMKNIPSKVDIL